jgi:FKBP-type peptidyl-prolyl cis-trans isomerase
LAGRPDLNSVVKVYYTGKLVDGTVFDERQSPEQPLPFPLVNLIDGWQEGIPYIGKGGKEKLLVPSHLGYGSRTQGSIPANSVLIFDIELVDYY